jgi:hypothetical protein
MAQQDRNMQECVTIDDKTLFVYLLVISVFVSDIYLEYYHEIRVDFMLPISCTLS